MTLTEDDVYSGTDNLEIMEEAANYQSFLNDLAREHAIEGDRVLDFGAGIGSFARVFSGSGFQVTCVEPDAGQARRLESLGLAVLRNSGDVPDASMDYVYSFNVLEHIEDDASTVADIFRIIKPGGRLLIYVPAFEILFSSMDRKVGHFRRYRLRGLSNILQHAGFEMQRREYADSLGFIATLVFKLVGNSEGDLNPRAMRIYDRWLFPVSRLIDRMGSRRLFGKNLLVTARKPV